MDNIGLTRMCGNCEHWTEYKGVFIKYGLGLCMLWQSDETVNDLCYEFTPKGQADDDSM